jgi:conjugative transfer signal peptidase TraF
MAEARDLPLFRWGEELRRARFKRARLRRRAALIGAGLGCLAATIVAQPVPRLLWNASASAPLGLYWVRPGAPVAVGDMVVAWPPHSAGLLASQRRYLPSGVPLVKRVVAVSGTTVCAKGAAVFVHQSGVFPRRRADSVGRPLPWWEGCLTLRTGEVFLLMAEAPDSFDGRYFGVTKGADVVGKAVLLWWR